jgi:hypothetical protein
MRHPCKFTIPGYPHATVNKKAPKGAFFIPSQVLLFLYCLLVYQTFGQIG